MAITPLPTPPSRSTPSTFADAADAFLGALPTFATQANALAVDVNADAATATVKAAEAQSHATAAASSALDAGATAWVSGTTYAAGDVRYSPLNFQTYRRTTNGGGTTDPSQDSTNWALTNSLILAQSHALALCF